MIRYIDVRSRARNEMIDITPRIVDLLHQEGVRGGVCHLFVLHTTAGITVNEGADPDVQRDLIGFLGTLVPRDYGFTHGEGNSDAHVKASLVGTSLTLLLENGRPLLGTWQAVYFCEFDGPRTRNVHVQIVGG